MFDFDNIDPDKIDFSMYHPIDHTLMECVDYPGGKRRHLEYRWKFQWEHNVRERTFCKLGRHRDTTIYARRPVEKIYEACMDCGRKK